MLRDTTTTAGVPLSLHTVSELRARAAASQTLAATASAAADIQAFEALAVRFIAAADRREAADRMVERAAQALATQLAAVARRGAKARMATQVADWPVGQSSPQSLKLATDAICRYYGMSEAILHPVIESEAIQLAALLLAYALVPPTSEVVAVQRVMAELMVALSKLAGKPRAAASLDPPDHDGQHILVVDDVADVLVSVRAFLASAGFVVETAANGDAALELIANDPQIGVLVTDFAMPGLSGAELITQALQIRPRLKALLITGYPNADGLAELPPHTAVLIKPFRRATLIAEVNSLLPRSPAMAEETVKLLRNEPP